MDLSSHDPLVPLEGAYNFRDLGGYRTLEGATVRTGLVYRSDGLAKLTDRDLEILRSLGLQTVIDFRRTDEREEAPTIVWDHGMELLHLGVDAAGDEQRDFLGQVLAGAFSGDPIDEVSAMYAAMLEEFADRFATLFSHVADPARRPLVFHCTAGKDRTGLAAMLLLGSLGVDHDTILHDYRLSHDYRTVRRIPELQPTFEEHGVDVEEVLPFIGAERQVMANTLDHIESHYGGILTYLRERAAVPDETLATVRDALLER